MRDRYGLTVSFIYLCGPKELVTLVWCFLDILGQTSRFKFQNVLSKSLPS